MRVLRSSGALWLGLLTVVLLVLPLVVTSRFAIDIFIRVLLFAFIGVAWNLIGGYAKQLSLGHAAYFGLGAYTSTILQIDVGISPGSECWPVELWPCWQACQSARCASGCAGRISRSPPSRPLKYSCCFSSSFVISLGGPRARPSPISATLR